MSFLLGLNQAFPLGSVWGSEDHMPFKGGGGMGDFRKRISCRIISREQKSLMVYNVGEKKILHRYLSEKKVTSPDV